MTTVMSVENAMRWSWGRTIYSLIERLKHYEWVRVERWVQAYTNEQGQQQFAKGPISADLVRHFDVTLLQNIDTVDLVRSEADFGKVVTRMGGMYLGEGYDPHRYDEQLKKCGAVISCSHELHAIARQANENAFMIPNGVDLDLFCPREGDREPGPFRVGFVGNVWHQAADYKGWKYYVQAVDIILLGEVDKRYILHGTDTTRDHTEMPGFYHSVDCIVMPSRGEGCSNTIKEALACGCPVLLTKVGYHGEMLRDNEDCIFIERDAAQLAAAITRLRDNPELQQKLAFNGRLFAENHHNIDTVAGAYDNVFKLILSNTKGTTDG